MSSSSEDDVSRHNAYAAITGPVADEYEEDDSVMPVVYAFASGDHIRTPLIDWVYQQLVVGCAKTSVESFKKRLFYRFRSYRVLPSIESIGELKVQELWSMVFSDVPSSGTPDVRYHCLRFLVKLCLFFWVDYSVMSGDHDDLIVERRLDCDLFVATSSASKEELRRLSVRTARLPSHIAQQFHLIFGPEDTGDPEADAEEELSIVLQGLAYQVSGTSGAGASLRRLELSETDKKRAAKLEKEIKLHRVWCTSRFDTEEQLTSREEPRLKYLLEQEVMFGRRAVESSLEVEMVSVLLFQVAFKYFSTDLRTDAVLRPAEHALDPSLVTHRMVYRLENIVQKSYDLLGAFCDQQWIMQDFSYDKRDTSRRGVSNRFVTSVNFDDRTKFFDLQNGTLRQKIIQKLLDRMGSLNYKRLRTDVFGSVSVSPHDANLARVCVCDKCGVWSRKHDTCRTCREFVPSGRSEVVCAHCFRCRSKHASSGKHRHVFVAMKQTTYCTLIKTPPPEAKRIDTLAYTRVDSIENVVRNMCSMESNSGLYMALTNVSGMASDVAGELAAGPYPHRFPDLEANRRFTSMANGVLDLCDPSIRRPRFYTYECHCRPTFRKARNSLRFCFPSLLQGAEAEDMDLGVPVERIVRRELDRRPRVVDVELENDLFVRGKLPWRVCGVPWGGDQEPEAGERVFVRFAAGDIGAWYMVSFDQSPQHYLFDLRLSIAAFLELVDRMCARAPALLGRFSYLMSYLDEDNEEDDLRRFVEAHPSSQSEYPLSWAEKARTVEQAAQHVRLSIDSHPRLSCLLKLMEALEAEVSLPGERPTETRRDMGGGGLSPESVWSRAFLDPSVGGAASFFDALDGFEGVVTIKPFDTAPVRVELVGVPELFLQRSKIEQHTSCIRCFDTVIQTPDIQVRQLPRARDLVTRNFIDFIVEEDRVREVLEGRPTPRRNPRRFHPECPPCSKHSLMRLRGNVVCRICREPYRPRDGRVANQMCTALGGRVPCCPWVVRDGDFNREASRLTPSFVSIFSSQNLFNADACEERTADTVAKRTENTLAVIFCMIGRLFFNVGQKDGWQLALFLKGIAGTGKSLTLQTVESMFPLEKICTISDNCQKDFTGLDDKAEIILSPEFGKGTNRSRTEFQSMASGERMSLNRKHLPALQVESWKSQQLLCGNEHPDWPDNAGQIARRLAIILFNVPVKKRDTGIKDRIKLEELGHILYQCIFAYNWYSDFYNGVDFWTFCPTDFTKARDQAACQDTMRSFVKSERLVISRGAFIPLADFKKEYHAFCHNEQRKPGAWNADLTREVFAKHNIRQQKKKKQYPPEDTPSVVRTEFLKNGGKIRTNNMDYLFGVGLAMIFGNSSPVTESTHYVEEDVLEQMYSELVRRRRAAGGSVQTIAEDLMQDLKQKLIECHQERNQATLPIVAPPAAAAAPTIDIMQFAEN